MNNWNKENKIKAIFLDVDGTLTMDNSFQINKRISDILIEAQKNNIFVILTTGRQLWSVNKLHSNYSFNEYGRYIISTLGSAVYDTKENKMLFSQSLPKEEIEKLLKFSLEHNFDLFTDFDQNIYTSRNLFSRLKLNSNSKGKYYFGYKFKGFKEFKKIQEKDLRKISFSNKTLNPEQTKEFYNKVVNHFPNLEVVVSATGLIELTTKGINKGSAIKQICQALNISLEETVGIGDSMNDFHMLKTVGHPIAMGNALQEIKEISKYQTKSDKDFGVEYALEKILNKS